MVGVYQLVMTVYLFGITLATSGINLAVTRVVSEELALDNLGGIKKVMKRCKFFPNSLVPTMLTPPKPKPQCSDVSARTAIF